MLVGCGLRRFGKALSLAAGLDFGELVMCDKDK